jgi:hypothetical protein
VIKTEESRISANPENAVAAEVKTVNRIAVFFSRMIEL